MLLVPTILRPSRIAGVGLFTPVPIASGTRIWAFDARVDWRLDPSELNAFPQPYQNLLRQWCYEEPDGRYVLCGDNAKFMNHSFAPNCLDLAPDATVTCRTIDAYEELTCDYRLIDVESARDGLESWGGVSEQVSSNQEDHS
jgi:SET domain-containing protein